MEHSFDLAGPYIHYGDYRYLNEIKAESLNYTKSIFNPHEPINVTDREDKRCEKETNCFMKFTYKGSRTVVKDKNIMWKFYVPIEKRVNEMVVDNKFLNEKEEYFEINLLLLGYSINTFIP